MCSFYGVTCGTSSPRHVQKLELPFNRLSGGPLPTGLDELTELSTLDLHGNAIRGTLDLVLGGGLLSPARLTTARLSANLFSGSVPSGVCSLRAIRTIDVSNNRLSGRLPDCKGGFASEAGLLELTVSSNDRLSGSVPTGLCFPPTVNTIQVLQLSGNNLTGTMPPCLMPDRASAVSDSSDGGIELAAAAGMPSLRVLDASFNSLAYDLSEMFPPAGFAPVYPALATLNLGHNFVTGPGIDVSAIMGAAPELVELVVSSCALGGMVRQDWPSSVPPPRSLQVLEISGGSINGTLPPWLCNATSLRDLDMSGNALTGGLPECLGSSLHGLRRLVLSNNRFSGMIPSSVGGMYSLEVFSIQHNEFRGLPSSICDMGSLRELDASYNSLTLLPFLTCRRCSNITSLESVDLSDNNLQTPTIEGMLPFLGLADIVSVRANQLSSLNVGKMLQCTESEPLGPDDDDEPAVPARGVRVLDASQNRLSKLLCPFREDGTGMVFGLSTLLLDTNLLDEVGAGDCLATGSWPLLEVINLSDNNFSAISRPRDQLLPAPSAFFPGATELRRFEASFNRIRGAAEVVLYPRLQELDLSYNDDLALTPEHLPSTLTFIDLSFTDAALTDSPAVWAWASLDFVTELRLQDTHFEGEIPEAMLGFSALRLIDMRSNPLCVNRSIAPKHAQRLGSGSHPDPGPPHPEPAPVKPRGIPSWLQPEASQAELFANGSYACPSSLVPSSAGRRRGANSRLRVLLDPTYYNYSLCDCIPGQFYGEPPSCTPCPDNAVCDPAVSTQPQCVPGFFFAEDTRTCVSCANIDGAECPGHLSPADSLWAKPGYWRNSSSRTVLHGHPVFLKCFDRLACEGGLHSAHHCEHGFEGPLCAACKAGYYQLEGHECEECPESHAIAALAIAGLIVGFAGFLVLYLHSRTPSKTVVTVHGARRALERRRQISAASSAGGRGWPRGPSGDSDSDQDEPLVGSGRGGRPDLSGTQPLSSHRRERGASVKPGPGAGKGHHEDGGGAGHHQHGHGAHEHDSLSHAEHAYHRLHLMVYFVQVLLNSRIVAGLLENDQGWTWLEPAAKSADQVMFYAYNSFTQLTTCTMGLTFVEQFWIILAAPVVVAVLLGFLQHLVGMRRLGMRVLLVAFLFYSGISVAAFHMVNCIDGAGQFGGRSHLQWDVRVLCGASDNGMVPFNMAVAWVLVVLWVCGIPAGLTLVLCLRRHSMPDPWEEDGLFCAPFVCARYRCPAGCAAWTAASRRVAGGESQALSGGGIAPAGRPGRHPGCAKRVALCCRGADACLAVVCCGQWAANRASRRRRSSCRCCAATRASLAWSAYAITGRNAPAPADSAAEGVGAAADAASGSYLPIGDDRPVAVSPREEPTASSVPGAQDSSPLERHPSRAMVLLLSPEKGARAGAGAEAETPLPQHSSRGMISLGASSASGNDSDGSAGDVDLDEDSEASDDEGPDAKGASGTAAAKHRPEAESHGSGEQHGGLDHEALFGSLAFLTHEYAPHAYFWEGIELSKTAAFNVVFRFVGWGLSVQFATATILAFAFLLVHAWVQPFSSAATNRQALFMALVLYLLCFCGLLLQLVAAETAAPGAAHSAESTFVDVVKSFMLALLCLWGVVFVVQLVAVVLGHSWRPVVRQAFAACCGPRGAISRCVRCCFVVRSSEPGEGDGGAAGGAASYGTRDGPPAGPSTRLQCVCFRGCSCILHHGPPAVSEGDADVADDCADGCDEGMHRSCDACRHCCAIGWVCCCTGRTGRGQRRRGRQGCPTWCCGDAARWGGCAGSCASSVAGACCGWEL